MLKGIEIEFSEFFIIYCDNTSIVSMSTNPMLHSKTKHISIKCHFFREIYQIRVCEYKREDCKHFYEAFA